MLSWNKRVFKKNPPQLQSISPRIPRAGREMQCSRSHQGSAVPLPARKGSLLQFCTLWAVWGFTSQPAWQGSGAQAMQLIQEQPPGISTPPQTNLSWGAPIELNAFGFLGHSWVGKVRSLMTRWFWDEIKPLGVIPSSSCLGKFISNR